ncbi:MAG: hypothetical protein KA116_12585 [Proteobacteria bacterium]|nr:hypothetical protein [Pseudomonadota bacterium]
MSKKLPNLKLRYLFWIWFIALIVNLSLFHISQWKGPKFTCSHNNDPSEFGLSVWKLLCSEK